jgi:hypothetical protein
MAKKFFDSLRKYDGTGGDDNNINKFEEQLFQTNVKIKKAMQVISRVNDIENFHKELDEKPLNVYLVDGIT